MFRSSSFYYLLQLRVFFPTDILKYETIRMLIRNMYGWAFRYITLFLLCTCVYVYLLSPLSKFRICDNEASLLVLSFERSKQKQTIFYDNKFICTLFINTDICARYIHTAVFRILIENNVNLAKSIWHNTQIRPKR